MVLRLYILLHKPSILPVVQDVLSNSIYSNLISRNGQYFLALFCRWPYRDCDYCFGRCEACACEHETKITWSLFILRKEDIYLIFCSVFFLSPCMQNKAVNTTERWKCYNKTFSYLIILNILLIIFLHIDRKDVSLIFIIFYLNYLWNIFLNPSK